MANDFPRSNRQEQSIKEFILIYKKEPCLWNVKSKEYYDKEKRALAYKRLVEKLKEIDAKADRVAVTKKINSLRTNHRKQMKKVEQAHRLGKIYKPKLWYYHMFDFLGNLNDTNLSCFTETNAETNDHSRDSEAGENSDENSHSDSEKSKPIFSQVVVTQNPLARVASPTRKKKFLRALYSKVNDIARTVGSPSNEHEFDVFGKSIASQLKAMPLPLALQAQQYIQNHLCELRLQLLNSPGQSPEQSSMKQHSNNEQAEYLFLP